MRESPPHVLTFAAGSCCPFRYAPPLLSWMTANALVVGTKRGSRIKIQAACVHASIFLLWFFPLCLDFGENKELPTQSVCVFSAVHLTSISTSETGLSTLDRYWIFTNRCFVRRGSSVQEPPRPTHRPDDPTQPNPTYNPTLPNRRRVDRGPWWRKQATNERAAGQNCSSKLPSCTVAAGTAGS